MVKRLSDRGFEARLSEPGPFAVAFFSHTSIPCGHFKAEFAAVAELFMEKLPCFTLDVDENPTTTDMLGLWAVPTTLVFRDGREIGRCEGPYARGPLTERIGALLAGKP